MIAFFIDLIIWFSDFELEFWTSVKEEVHSQHAASQQFIFHPSLRSSWDISSPKTVDEAKKEEAVNVMQGEKFYLKILGVI